MIVTKKAIDRRAVLRGAGLALSLPLLDAMIPALTASAATPLNPTKLRRIGYVYVPMGYYPNTGRLRETLWRTCQAVWRRCKT